MGIAFESFEGLHAWTGTTKLLSYLHINLSLRATYASQNKSPHHVLRHAETSCNVEGVSWITLLQDLPKFQTPQGFPVSTMLNMSVTWSFKLFHLQWEKGMISAIYISLVKLFNNLYNIQKAIGLWLHKNHKEWCVWPNFHVASQTPRQSWT